MPNRIAAKQFIDGFVLSLRLDISPLFIDSFFIIYLCFAEDLAKGGSPSKTIPGLICSFSLNFPTSVSKDAIITISVIPSCVCEDTLVWAGFTWLVTSISDSSFEIMGRSMSFDVVAAGIAESLNFIL